MALVLSRFFRGSGVPTEARYSIRESLRIFRCIEVHLETQRSSACNKSSGTITAPIPESASSLLLFERLITETANSQSLVFDGIPSCGLASQCFASLFFSQQQIASFHIVRHTNGSDIAQLWDNWNLLLYGQLKRYSRANCWKINDWAERISKLLRFRAELKANELSASILRIDSDAELPRVVFCNLTWVLLHDRSTHPAVNIDTCSDPSNDVKDHQWSIIKHANDHFQIVQGYIGTSSSRGHCLSGWQDSSISPFSSRHGFGLSKMRSFLTEIHQFATSPAFDAESYKSVFGVFHQESSNVAVWPAVSFREINDDSIEGYGDRFVADAIIQKLQLPQSQS